MTRIPRPLPTPVRCRTGSPATLARGSRVAATLTEVLMSLLIMSVGVLSVMSLFPISLLRTINAAQTTNATLLNDNAIEELLAQSELLDGVPHWQPNQRYFPGSIVKPLPKPGASGADTNRMFLCKAGFAGTLPAPFNAGVPAYAPAYPTISATRQPQWDQITYVTARGNNFLPANRQGIGALLSAGTPLNVANNLAVPEYPAGSPTVPAIDLISQGDLPRNTAGGGGFAISNGFPWVELFPETGTAYGLPIEQYVAPGPLGQYDVNEAYAARTTVYVVDPLGWVERKIADEALTAPTYPTTYGFGPAFNFGTGGTDFTGGADDYVGLARFDAGLRNAPINSFADPNNPGLPTALDPTKTRTQRLGLANAMVGLPDSYDEIARVDQPTVFTYTPPTGTTPATSTFVMPRTIDESDLFDFAVDIEATGGGRLVVNSPADNQSVALPIVPGGIDFSNPTAVAITVEGGVGVPYTNVGAGFPDVNASGTIEAAEIGTVSIQNYQPQFSFITVVRKNAVGNTAKSVAVFFNRQTDTETERPIRASFGGFYDVDDDGVATAADVDLQPNEVLLQWNYGGDTTIPKLPEERPALREGKYLLDADEGFFYEIQEVLEEPEIGGATLADAAIVRIDRDARISHGIGANPASPGRDGQAHALLLPGIIRVFEQGMGE